MKNLLLIMTCLLFVFLYPAEKLGGEGYADKNRVNSEMNTPGNDSFAEEIGQDAEDMLYDENAINLLATYNSPNDDVIPTRLNRWSGQLRVLTSRLQWRCHSITVEVKRLTHLLSIYLTTLINHTSQSYSTLKQLCWQYAVDCYVFAFRQIII